MKIEIVLPPEYVQEIAKEVAELLKDSLLSSSGESDKYMTTKELASYLGLAYSTIANNKKYLPHTYLNGTPLFKKSEIDKYLQQSSVKPKTKNQKFIELFNGKR